MAYVSGITAEQLVTAFSAEDHGDVLPRSACQQDRRHGCRIAEWFAESDEIVQGAKERLGIGLDRGVPNTDGFGEPAGEATLVVRPFGEADRERMRPVAPETAGGQTREDSGIEATASEHPDRHVGEELLFDRRRDDPAQMRDVGWAGADRQGFRPPVTSDGDAVGLCGQNTSRGDLEHLGERRARLGNVSPQHVLSDGFRVESSRNLRIRQEGPDLGGEM